MRFLLDFATNFVTSILFLYFVLVFFRPKIKISSQIAKQKNTFDQASEYYYVFKIINKSKFDAFDVQLELFELLFYPGGQKGVNTRFTPLSLKSNNIKQIPGYRRLGRQSTMASHCILFRTTENIESIISEEGKSVELQITLKHGLTGLSRVYSMRFTNLNSIKYGTFGFGNELQVV